MITDRNKKLRTETIVASIFAFRMGFSKAALSFPRKEIDGTGPDACLKAGARSIVLELTAADPEASGALPPNRHGSDIYTGGLRAAQDRLVAKFYELPMSQRPLSVNVWFRKESGKLWLPRSPEVDSFLRDLSQLSFENLDRCLVSQGPIEFRKFASSLLTKYCDRIGLEPPPTEHFGGLISVPQLSAVWVLAPDIDAIVQLKAAKSSGADWLVVFQWDAPGAIPPDDALPKIRESCFERVFLLDPAIGGRLLEWRRCQSGWLAPSELCASYGEREFVTCFLANRGLPGL